MVERIPTAIFFVILLSVVTVLAKVMIYLMSVQT